MPYNTEFDPFDPEERRRRLAFQEDAADTSESDASESMPGASQAMAPDEQDSDPEGEDTPAAPVAAQSGGTDAQRRYRDTLQHMPQQADYKPSKWRRFGAALAGGLAGASGGAESGVKTANTILRQPYDRAQEAWGSNVNRGALEMGLDKDMAAQDIARRRAGAYEESAHARTKAASATEAWRLSQEKNVPWHPQNEEEATRFEQSKHTPPKPTAFEQYSSDPDGYRKYLNDVNAGKTQPLTFEERAKLEGMRQAGANSRNNARIAARPAPKDVMASPADQGRAEQLAMEQVSRTNPEYGRFMELGDPKKKIPHRVKTPNEIDGYNYEAPGLFGGGTSQVKAGLTKDNYADFLDKLNRAKKRILGSTKQVDQGSQSGGGWNLDEEDDQ